MSIQNQAKQFAIFKHDNQKYESVPYIIHLNHVVSVLTEYGYAEEDEIMSAAWLHDTIEDTNTSHLTLFFEFGKEIADIVWAVSSEPGENRQEKFIKTAPKILSNKKAIIVKLADRIANTEASLAANKRSLVRMYEKEFPLFYRLLYRGDLPMWEKLKKLNQID